MLLDCMTHDPRVDHQCEQRGRYFAELARAVDLDIAPLAAHLRENDDEHPQAGWRTSLTLEVLGHLLSWGRDGTAEVLLDYVRHGSHWSQAAEELEHAEEEVLLEAADALADRIDAGAIAWWALPWRGSLRERVWLDHPRLGPSLRPLREDRRNSVAEREEPRAWGWMRATVDYLDDLRPGAENEGLLKSMLRGDAAAAREFLGLYRIAEPVPGYGRLAVRRVLQEVGRRLPAEDARLVARENLDLDPAWDLLKESAAEEDREVLEDIVREFLEGPPDQVEPGCSALDCLGRVASPGSWPVLLRVYEEVSYSYARWRAVRAMAACHPERFRRELAEECLWDCEDGTCQEAVRTGPPPSEQVQARLAELADLGSLS